MIGIKRRRGFTSSPTCEGRGIRDPLRSLVIKFNQMHLISVLVITVLTIFMLINIVGATPFAYITNLDSNNVSVIDTATKAVATVDIETISYGLAVTPDETKVYGAAEGINKISIINTSTNTVTTTLDVGIQPEGVAVTPDGSKVYVANSLSNTLSIIDTDTNDVITVGAGSHPVAFGQFIGPKSRAIETPSVTWSNPADIVYGTALSPAQLSASAPIPGKLV